MSQDILLIIPLALRAGGCGDGVVKGAPQFFYSADHSVLAHAGRAGEHD